MGLQQKGWAYVSCRCCARWRRENTKLLWQVLEQGSLIPSGLRDKTTLQAPSCHLLSQHCGGSGGLPWWQADVEDVGNAAGSSGQVLCALSGTITFQQVVSLASPHLEWETKSQLKGSGINHLKLLPWAGSRVSPTHSVSSLWPVWTCSGKCTGLPRLRGSSWKAWIALAEETCLPLPRRKQRRHPRSVCCCLLGWVGKLRGSCLFRKTSLCKHSHYQYSVVNVSEEVGVGSTSVFISCTHRKRRRWLCSVWKQCEKILGLKS